MRNSKFWWSFVQTRRNNAFRGNIVAQIWRRWASRSRASWWRRGNIFWWDRRSWRSWDLRRSKWLWPCFRPQFDLLWLFLDGFKLNRKFLSWGSLEESQKRRRIDLLLRMSLHVRSQPPSVFAFPSTMRTTELKHRLCSTQETSSSQRKKKRQYLSTEFITSFKIWILECLLNKKKS